MYLKTVINIFMKMLWIFKNKDNSGREKISAAFLIGISVNLFEAQTNCCK